MMRDDEHPPDLPEIPRPASLPVRITREVAVPVVAIAYMGFLSFLLFYGKLQESSYVALVAAPVGGYLGSLVPGMKKEAR
jgi:hypothetical protein